MELLLYTFVLAVAGAMKPKTAATKAECDTFIASLDADAIVSAKYVRIIQFNVTMCAHYYTQFPTLRHPTRTAP